MKRIVPPAHALIAIPCYGNRVMPRFGQTRDICFAEADLSSRRLLTLEQQSWNPADEPLIVRWLHRKGVDTVLCGGIHPRFQVALEAEKIRVVWGFRGEVEEIVRLWLSEGDLSRTVDCRPFWAQENGQP